MATVDVLLDCGASGVASGAVIDPQVVEQLVASLRRSAKTPLEFLTPREREVLSTMAQGKSKAAIAAALVMSEQAVVKHINAIFSKLHLHEEADVNRRVTALLSGRDGSYATTGSGRGLRPSVQRPATAL